MHGERREELTCVQIPRVVVLNSGSAETLHTRHLELGPSVFAVADANPVAS
jgi:hypothetical protein